MKIAEQDAVLIKNLYLLKGWAHESCWMNFLTKVGNWEVSTTSWRKSARRVPLTDSQAVADRVRHELMRTLKQCTCTESGGQAQNAPIDVPNLTQNWHLPFQCPKDHSLWSSTQVPQVTSCATTVWSQLRRPSDSLQTATEKVRRFCSQFHMVHGWKSVYRWTTIHFAAQQSIPESTRRSEPGSDLFNPAVCHTCARPSASPLWCRLPCQKWVWLS